MDRVNLFVLYQAGAELQSFAALGRGKLKPSDIFSPVMSAKAAINILLADGSPVKLELSRSAAEDVRSAIENLYQEYFMDSISGAFTFPDTKDDIEYWKISFAQMQIRTFETVFRAEVQNAATYRVPKKGTFDVADLIDRAENAFSPDIIAAIPEAAIVEYRAAGRCYAFGLHTASGYHSCRAVEAVLRYYYCCFTSKFDSGKETWGELIGELEKIAKNNSDNGILDLPSSKTLSHIRHIKDYDRNPLSHLRSVLDHNDADVLLSSAKIAIIVMVREIRSEKAAMQLSLPFIQDNDAKEIEMPFIDDAD